MKNRTRNQQFVDRSVQGSLMLRTVLYWAFCMVNVTVILLVWRLLTGPTRLSWLQLVDAWQQYGPALVASALLVPLIVVDVVRFSNRFTGPVHRLRQSMARLAKGEHVPLVRFREGDFWQEFADDFNQLAARVEQLERAGSNLPPMPIELGDATPEWAGAHGERPAPNA